MGKVELTAREFTKEEAEALLPTLKADTEAALDQVALIEGKMRVWLKDHGMRREEAFAKSEEYRALAAERRMALFAWGASLQSGGVYVESPNEGAVRLECTDGTRRWKLGDEDYGLEPKAIAHG